jgi:hypothetical protein
MRPTVPALAIGLAGLVAVGNAAVNVTHGVPWRSPVITTNWATASDYARVADALGERAGSATVAGPGEIGTLAYHCECAIVDEFSDRGVFIWRVNRRIGGAGPVVRLLLDLNFVWLDRNQQPRPTDYRLLYTPGAREGRDVWQVSSSWRGVGHFALVPASARSRDHPRSNGE